MKSENILLTACLMFILVILSGLTVQSCKSSSNSTAEKSVQVDSSARLRATNVSDLSMLIHRLQLDQENYEWNIEEYIPLTDSAGRVTGTAIISRNTGKRSGSRQQNESAAIVKKDSANITAQSQLKSSDAQRITKSKQVKSVSFSIYTYLFFAILFIFFIRIRWPTLWGRFIDFIRRFF